ncbi:short-chain dehydrogenase [Kitasatospora herbaricolor]|uniref:SDR family oxidoreductase n=1 Tax=Kitasatospora herbaricolor TaxID=68217 RepID=UPI00174A6935|nr:SDR family oxidoreductase [Kitasatospora herbaricolor]MDQ0311663.1 NAD(P)-dependent dehydrogenase (short-subunit alcohol dehydrogenase family) [Kitasatospora herbaricolor]GGU95852.1 short-chain dehydrogenase [Kitasatospora herbaricolor]
MSTVPPLSAQVVVVTGAARGVGATLARKLAARGAKVALVGLEPAELKEAAALCGPDASSWEADVTDVEALTTTARAIQERYGRIDAVVANAGIAIGGPLLDSDHRAFSRVIEVNLLGSVATARAFLPALAESGGYLLQIASLAAMTPAPLMSAYCASKSGVEAFAHALRAEVAHQGVKVGVGYLSWTDTDMVRGADQDVVLRQMRSRLPWPANKTYPLDPAVDRLVAGIARRAAHVYAQAWLRAMQPVRSLLPGLIATVGARDIAKLAPQLRATASTRMRPVGAGGEADSAARSAGSAGGTE